MKFQTTKTGLLESILFASRVINPKNSTIILSGIMMETEKELTVYSTDLETSIKCKSPVKVIEKGKVVVPARVFVNILKSLKESKIEVGFNNSTNQVVIECDKAFFTLNTLPVGEYPEFPVVKREMNFKISSDKFRLLVNKVQKAASVDESRATLTGILFEITEGVLSMVATDSYRLAIAKENVDKDLQPISVIIPSKVLDSVSKSEYKGSDIEISIEENQISFYMEGDEKRKDIIVSRLLSGKFPEYKQLIPGESRHEILVEKERMLDVVKRISSISQDSIPVRLTIDKGKITVSMSVKEVGDSSEDLEVSYVDDKIEIAFNPEFLMDGISTIDGKNIVLSINDPLKPVLIKPEKNSNVIYLLMPIRVS